MFRNIVQLCDKTIAENKIEISSCENKIHQSISKIMFDNGFWIVHPNI